MNIKNTLSALTFLLIGSALFAQSGVVRGKIFEDATGEDLIGVTVMLEGTGKGAITDFLLTLQTKKCKTA